MSDTESFESVINESFVIAKAKLQIAFEGSLFERLLSDLQAAHDREIRDVGQREYHRGYEDGRHSMDAEHAAVAMRLRGLRFDGGSHENLASIAYAIYPCATGWTCESAAGLRDKLIELMGGVSKPSFADQAKDLMNTIIEEGNKRLQNDGREMQDETEDEIGTANDSRIDTDCGDCGRDFHVDELSITDELRRWADANTLKDVALTTYPVQHAVHGILEQLISIADRIDERVRHKLDQYRETHVELPKDADGEYVHVGDQLCVEDLTGELDEPRIVAGMIYYGDHSEPWMWEDEDGSERRFRYAHAKPEADTAETIVRELSGGKISEQEAINRIDALKGAK